MDQEATSASDLATRRSENSIAGIIDSSLALAGVLFASGYFLAWLLLPSWVHLEFFEVTHNYLLKPDETLFGSLPEHVFNLHLLEDGLYRPRLLTFLLCYLDTNGSFLLHSVLPHAGIKLPSYGVSIVATVGAFVWFWRSLFPKGGYGIAVLGGVSLLYYDVYMNTTFMVLRGSKLLVPAAGLFCMTVYIRHARCTFTAKRAGFCIAWSCVVFLLATMDEQVTALLYFVAAIALVATCIEKRISQAAVIFLLPATAYPLYYFFWGRWLFARFTPGGIRENFAGTPYPVEHFSDVLGMRMTDVFRAVEILTSNMIELGIPSLVLLGVFVVSVARILRQKKSLPYNLLICSAFLLFPVLLTASMIASRPMIYTIHVLWYLFYVPFAVHLLMATTAWSLSLANFETPHLKAALAAAFLATCATGAYEMPTLRHAACVGTASELGGFPCGSVDWVDHLDEKYKNEKSAMFRVKVPPDDPLAIFNTDPTASSE